jgi:hypothetical protein
MWQLIIGMIKDAQGVMSSKRGAMLWFILLFTSVAIVNLCTGGKVHLEPTLQTQLFELVIISMGIVFGEPFAKAIELWKGSNKNPQPPAQ